MARTQWTDLEWLLSPEGIATVESVSESTHSLTSLTSQLRRTMTPARAHMVLEQIDLRRRAAKKFRSAGKMFFDPLRLQQATSDAIAQYKSRWHPTGTVADLCCGIGGDAIGLKRRRSVLAVDIDPAMCLLTQHNCLQHVGPPVRTVTQDVTKFDLRSCDSWHIDPDRRSSGSRVCRVEYYCPDVESIDAMLAINEQAAIKLAPGCRVPKSWEERSQLEWIGHEREAKQLVARFDGLATAIGRRTATVLDRKGNRVAQTTGVADVFLPASDSVGERIGDPHAVLKVSQLVGDFAVQHGYQRWSYDAPFLSANAELVDGLPDFSTTGSAADSRTSKRVGEEGEPAGAIGYLVDWYIAIDEMAFDRKRVKSALRDLGAGTVTIKTHAKLVRPELEIKKLVDSKRRGSTAITLFVLLQRDRVRCVIARKP